MKLLYVEDDARDADLTRRALARDAPHIQLDLVSTIAEAHARLAEAGRFDLLLVDLSLPDGSGLELVVAIRARGLAVAVVALTGTDASDSAVAALKAGADDYLVKRGDYLARLPSALASALARFGAEAVRRSRMLRVLYAEDTPSDVESTRQHFARHAAQIHLEVVHDGKELFALLGGADEPSRYDVVLLDYCLAGLDGLDVLKTLRDERCLEIPVVVVTGMADGEIAAHAFRFGAADVVVKQPGYLFQLTAALGAAHDRAQLHREQATLRESEERFRAVFESSPTAMGLASVSDGRLLDVNPALAEIFGYAREELLGKTTSEFGMWVDVEDRRRYYELLQRDGRVTNFEAVLRRKDGGLVTALFSGSTIRVRDEPMNLAAMTDITERMRARDALRASEERFRTLFDQAAVGMAQVDRRTFRMVRVNQKYADILGYTPDELVGVHFMDLTPPEDVPHDWESRGRFESGEVGVFAMEKRYVRKDGALVWVNLTVSPMESAADGSDPPFNIVVVEEITSRKQAEAAVRESEERFRAVFEHSPDAILIANQEGVVTLANRKASSLFGYRHEELVGLPVEALIPEAARGRHVALRQRFLSTTEPRPMGARGIWLRALRKDGSTFPADIGRSPMLSSDGPLVVAAVRDVTERAQAEEAREQLEVQLREARKMQAIGTLAGGIAHDFNNLLSVVVANVELARDDIGCDHPIFPCLEDIGVAAARGADLVRQILAFSRKEAPQRVVVSLRKMFERRRGCSGHRSAGTELTLRIDDDVPAVLADATQLQRVLMNLGTNAKHALEGRVGRITLELDAVAIDATSPPMNRKPRPGRYARIGVSDTGAGMGAVTLERAFEPFFTTKAVGKGSGLGLAVVHGIVQAHDGTITVDSRPEEGTTFRIYLPAVSSAREVDSVQPVAEGPLARQGLRVLFLDDEHSLVMSGDARPREARIPDDRLHPARRGAGGGSQRIDPFRRGRHLISRCPTSPVSTWPERSSGCGRTCRWCWCRATTPKTCGRSSWPRASGICSPSHAAGRSSPRSSASSRATPLPPRSDRRVTVRVTCRLRGQHAAQHLLEHFHGERLADEELAPPSVACSRIAGVLSEVTNPKRTGSFSALTAESSSMPLISGMFQSHRTTSKASRRSAASPSTPFPPR